MRSSVHLIMQPSRPTPSEIEFSAQLRGHNLTFHTTWGLFSPKAIDEGTRLLLDNIELAPTDQALDLGCGYGPLGLTLATMAPQGSVDMVDKDFVAIEYATLNARLNSLKNAHAYLSNGFSHVEPSKTYDLIVSNLPAKIGGELLDIFITDAYDRLNPGGRLYVVTISGLKEYIKRHLSQTFGNYTKLKQSRTYTAAVARKKA